MEKSIKIAIIMAAILFAVFVFLAIAFYSIPVEGPEPHPPGGLANPAAVYCIDQGYELAPPKDGEDATCVFPDGSECPQWDFFNEECGQEWIKE